MLRAGCPLGLRHRHALDHPGIEIGEQLYGYWPLASHAVLLPDRVNAVGFTEITPRRTALPALYNQYQRLSALTDHDPADHDWWPVYRPLTSPAG